MEAPRRGLKIRMPEEFLDGANAHPIADRMGGEGVAYPPRGDAILVEVRLFEPSWQHPPDDPATRGIRAGT